MFGLQNTGTLPPKLELEGLEVATRPFPVHATAVDLSLDLYDPGEAIVGTLEYASDLLGPEAAARLIAHYQALLAEMAERPGARLSALELLPADERERLVVEWNRTE